LSVFLLSSAIISSAISKKRYQIYRNINNSLL